MSSMRCIAITLSMPPPLYTAAAATSLPSLPPSTYTTTVVTAYPSYHYQHNLHSLSNHHHRCGHHHYHSITAIMITTTPLWIWCGLWLIIVSWPMTSLKKGDLIAIFAFNGVICVGGMRNHWIIYGCIVPWPCLYGTGYSNWRICAGWL